MEVYKADDRFSALHQKYQVTCHAPGMQAPPGFEAHLPFMIARSADDAMNSPNLIDGANHLDPRQN